MHLAPLSAVEIRGYGAADRQPVGGGGEEALEDPTGDVRTVAEEGVDPDASASAPALDMHGVRVLARLRERLPGLGLVAHRA